MSEWQPIETAPKDGSKVLLALSWGGTFGHGIGRMDDDGKWWDEAGEYSLGSPTHWMPLPAPPAARETGDAK